MTLSCTDSSKEPPGKLRGIHGSRRTPCDGKQVAFFSTQEEVFLAQPGLHRRTVCDGYPEKPKQASGN